MAYAEILNGNGTKIISETTPHTLWQPKPNQNLASAEPLWYLRVSAMKDHDMRGDCPNRLFAFKSQEDLTTAANQLEAMFENAVQIKKCGITFPDAMGGRVNDGRCEHITIEYDSDEPNAIGWKEFLKKLEGLEAEWTGQNMSAL